MTAKADTEPGYTAHDILEEIQGAVWDRMEPTSPIYTGTLGAATWDSPAGDPLILTDCYGVRWVVTVEHQS